MENMNKKELDIELDKIHEKGDKIFIPSSLAEEMLDREIKKGIENLSK